ncbi:MAG: TIGR03960 family B12-binding radical SAM protein [Desulfobaccales bacterium]
MPEPAYLSRVRRPTRYLGGEINAVHKDPRSVSLRVALLFPDLYEVGMSHLGLGLLYGILNREETIWAERAYAPAPDLEYELRRQGRPLASLESGTPLGSFDLLGVSLQYELGYTNFLNLLDLSGVPLQAAGRGPGDPVVIAGGPACFNPEPLAPFLDAVLLGDGEEALLEVAAAVSAWKAGRGSRRELWHALEEIEGVYVPAFFSMEFDGEGRLREIQPQGRRQIIRKRVLDDLQRISVSPQTLVPFCQIIHDRLNLEIARGCSRGCRYCQAGMIYRPVRERRAADLLSWAETALAASGYEEISLLTLSAGDYQPLTWLLTGLMDQLSARQVAISLPSLRADTLTPEIMAQIKRVRRTGLTLAPEAGSERLRRAINKNLPDEVILASARAAGAAGWGLLKLYFMLGLPREGVTDREAIPRLAVQILGAGGRRSRLNVSLGCFIPKSHTPFQWERQLGLEEYLHCLHRVKDGLRHPQVQVKWNAPSQAWLEGVFSRGDRRLAPVLLAAHRLGCRLDAWSEHLRLEEWRQAFKESGVDPDFYLRERDPDEVLPWDHISCGVSREFLLQERQRAYVEMETPDCRLDGCQDCGVCDRPGISLRLEQPPELPPSPPAAPAAAAQPPFLSRYRLTYSKLEQARWLSHLELVTAIYRTLRRSGLPLAHTAGYHPLPRVSFHGALPVGVESMEETLDLQLEASLEPALLAATLNRALPPGLRILNATSLPQRLPPPRREMAVYQVEAPEDAFSLETAAEFLARKEFPAVRRRPNKEDRSLDLRPLVAKLVVADPRRLELHLRLQEKDNPTVAEALAQIFILNQEQSQDIRILKMPGAGPGAGPAACCPVASG